MRANNGSSTPERLKGIYLRGKIFWYRYSFQRRQYRVSLQTSDDSQDGAELKGGFLNYTYAQLSELTKEHDDRGFTYVWLAAGGEPPNCSAALRGHFPMPDVRVHSSPCHASGQKQDEILKEKPPFAGLKR